MQLHIDRTKEKADAQGAGLSGVVLVESLV